MPTIKGFTTKKDIVKQLKEAGAVVVLPFEVDSFKAQFNPFKGMKTKDKKGKKINIKKKWLWIF